ncbi:putative F-box/FBD/LRR-repeat protein At5g25850 [Silene latifolia]|uniref:putative F-box/FBD/LRR-repeat protein At5g25850 n=1 Tax=Silene latifolia TaxID=37657 RepID=UPI003D77390F
MSSEADKQHHRRSSLPEDDSMLSEAVTAVNSSLLKDDPLLNVPAINRYHHRWISLPDDIFLEIIARVGLPREVVITVSTTNFSIEQTHAPTYDLNKFWTALDNLFTVLVPPITDTFCLDLNIAHYSEHRCWPIIDAWARQLRACNIQHFTATKFSRNISDEHVYPLSIFRMHSLVSLDLNMCHRIASSTSYSIILPNLKKLQLSWINYECLRRLLSCCPSLEDLSVSIYESKTHSVSLTSKKLKRLCMRLEGVSIVDVIIDAPILDKLNYSTMSTLSMQMLDSVSNIIKSLELEVYNIGVSRGSKKRIIFPNLTYIQLSCSWHLVIDTISMVHFPKLEVIVLRLNRGGTRN